MKIIKVLSIVLVATLMSSCNKKSGVTNKSLVTEIDSVSYALGINIGTSVKSSFGEDVDNELLIQGYTNAIDSSDILIENGKVEAILRSYITKKQAADQAKLKEEAQKKAEAQYADVKVAGEKFLEENMTKEGVEITESGLQYMVIKEGTGEKPTAASKVKVHYHGTLIDGTVFDSSVDRGEPTEFGVGQVIPGWKEGLQLMSVGSKYKFFIPQDIGYGAFPRQGGVIKPFAALVFDVELLEIVK